VRTIWRLEKETSLKGKRRVKGPAFLRGDEERVKVEETSEAGARILTVTEDRKAGQTLGRLGGR